MMFDPNERGSFEIGMDRDGNSYSAYMSWTHPERSYDTRNVPKDAPVPQFCNGDCRKRLDEHDEMASAAPKKWSVPAIYLIDDHFVPCPKCSQTGRDIEPDLPCPLCNGYGWVASKLIPRALFGPITIDDYLADMQARTAALEADMAKLKKLPVINYSGIMQEDV